MLFSIFVVSLSLVIKDVSTVWLCETHSDNLFSKGQTHTKKPDTVIRNFHPVILILNPPPNLHIMAEIRIFRVIPDHQQGIRCNAADDALMVDQG